MSNDPPPVPPANRSPKGHGSAPAGSESDIPAEKAGGVPQNLHEQGQQGNMDQNATGEGMRQKR